MNEIQLKEFVGGRFGDAQQALQKFCADPANIALVQDCAQRIANCLEKGGKVISFGNGGSMCDAMHFAEELTGRFKRNRRALPAIAVSDPSHLSCVANDYGYQFVFSRYVEAHGKPGDIVLGLSTSGNSPNVIEAFKTARERDVFSIALTGQSGGEAAKNADLLVKATADRSDRIQEIHIKIIHIIIDAVEHLLFPNQG